MDGRKGEKGTKLKLHEVITSRERTYNMKIIVNNIVLYTGNVQKRVDFYYKKR